MARASAPVWLLAAALTLTACGGGDGDTAASAAEARVTAKEKALAEAQQQADATAEAFCAESSNYIVALDRYGDVLGSTAPTVGDVREAGADLEQPREDATSAAEAVEDARSALSDAQEELKQARAELAELEGTKAPKAPQVTPPPSPPSESVNRVKQAESELETTQEGITDQTPLAQASAQFNAAAVALELSWLRLFADAGCLTEDQRVQAEQAVADYTRALQQALADAGYFQGEQDGIYGPETVAAVEELQRSHGLPVTGAVDKATAAALESDLTAQGGATAQEAAISTAALQQTLTLVGFWDGPVDGAWTPELTEALEAFQEELGVKPTGTVDAATVAAFERALRKAREALEETPTPTESATPSETPAPTPSETPSATPS